MLIDGHSYSPLPARLGETLDYRHRQCLAAGGKDDHKARLRVTLKEPHTYLWKCHHCGKSGKARAYTPNVTRQPDKPTGWSIPQDTTYRLPLDGELWLQEAGLSIERAKHYRIGYSPSKNALVMPIQQLSDGKPVGHILRLLGNAAPTRYLSRLNPERKLAGLKKGLQCCVIVEDWLSAVRIAENDYTAVCLMGTSLSKQGYWELVNTDYLHYLVWLDNDSELVRSKARSIQGTMLALGKECTLHLGKEEPKRLTDRQIADTMLSVLGTDSLRLSNSLD